MNARDPHPLAVGFRKTVKLVRTSPAAHDALVDAAALALDLFAVLVDAGVFDLALDFPEDTDDRMVRLVSALQEAAKTTPGADVEPDPAFVAGRQKLIDDMHAAASHVLDQRGYDLDSLPRQTALLLKTVASFMQQGHLKDISGMLPRRFGKVAEALAAVPIPEAVQA